jgi:hypothetical protein
MPIFQLISKGPQRAICSLRTALGRKRRRQTLIALGTRMLLLGEFAAKALQAFLDRYPKRGLQSERSVASGALP